jgi:hypothetical protein
MNQESTKGRSASDFLSSLFLIKSGQQQNLAGLQNLTTPRAPAFDTFV